MVEKRPPRTLGPFHDTFWEYCNKEEFRLQKCNDCGHMQYPPSPMCTECMSNSHSWEKIKGEGTIISHCTFHRQYFPECPPPWHVILVQLDEGPAFTQNPKDQGVPIEELKADPVVCGALGEHVLSHFLDAKQAEWDEYRTHVSDWEVARSLEQY